MDAMQARNRLLTDGGGSAGALGFLLLAIFLIRAIHAGQPIVENYVGRQIPTAMVARNLERGSGVFRPQLDTAPYPNYFVVEPPLYESGVVVLRRLTGMKLEAAGRILSALLMTLAGWGLFDLANRREGRRVALLSVLAFACFPLTIRYGRAFQPDASMLGAVVAGLACWDRYRCRPGWHWLLSGWCLLALGFALKITSAFLLVPIVFLIGRPRGFRSVLVACSTVAPAVLWYLWANHLIAESGSRASADNRSIWLGLLGPTALLQPEVLTSVGRFLFSRAFTPLGAGLAFVGLYKAHGRDADGDQLWWVWGISALVTMAILAQKLHHEYYWLPLAPVAAVGVGRALARIAGRQRGLAIATAGSLLLLCWVQARSTWRTPPEWDGLAQAARVIRSQVPRECWVAAPEALLFQADRRGCRMEWTASAAGRAACEWGTAQPVERPLDLIEFYRQRGARYFADLGSGESRLQRKGLHDAVRQRYKVIVDNPEAIIADLADSGTHWNAN